MGNQLGYERLHDDCSWGQYVWHCELWSRAGDVEENVAHYLVLKKNKTYRKSN